MKNHRDLGELTRSVLEQNWKLEREDLGEDAHLAKSGMAFDTEAWTIPGLGHLCRSHELQCSTQRGPLPFR